MLKRPDCGTIKIVKRSLDSIVKNLSPLRNTLQQLWTLHSLAATQIIKNIALEKITNIWRPDRMKINADIWNVRNQIIRCWWWYKCCVFLTPMSNLNEFVATTSTLYLRPGATTAWLEFSQRLVCLISLKPLHYFCFSLTDVRLLTRPTIELSNRWLLVLFSTHGVARPPGANTLLFS